VNARTNLLGWWLVTLACLAPRTVAAETPRVLPPEASGFFQGLLARSELTRSLDIEIRRDHAVYRFKRGAAVAEIEVRDASTCASPAGALCLQPGAAHGPLRYDRHVMRRYSPLTVPFALSLAGCAPEPSVPIQIGGTSRERAGIQAPPVAKPSEPSELPLTAPDTQVATASTTQDTPPTTPVTTSSTGPGTPVAILSTPLANPVAAPPPWPGPPLDVARDLRPGTRSPRSSRLLVTACRGIETLVPPFGSYGKADRPRLVLELANTYAELAVSAQQPAQAITWPPAPTWIAPARRRAILYYQMFASQYPQACAGASPNTPCADEALYYLGIEREREGDSAAARNAYQALLSNHPRSRFVPGAHLALGELFLAESGQDASKLAFAEAAYGQALKYPAPDNVLFGYAHHQLGRVRLQQGARARAAASFRAAIAWAAANLSVPGAGDIAVSAQRELRALQGV
jgi:hypothetical protein